MVSGLKFLKKVEITRFPHNLIFRALSFLLLSISLFCCLGCKPRQNPVEESTRNNILLVGLDAEITSLDPQLCHTPTDRNVHSALFEGLLRYGPQNLTPIPALAYTYYASLDYTHFRFYIRTNATWSDGEFITVDDFLFSFKRILSSEIPSPSAYKLYPIKNAQAYHEGKITDFAQVGVKSIRPNILEFILEKPSPYFLSLLCDTAYYPVPKHILLQENLDVLESSSNPVFWNPNHEFVSNGPFRLIQYQMNQAIILEKNPNYWNAHKVSLQGLRFFPFSSALTEELSFRAGQLHITHSIPASKFDTLKAENSPLLKVSPHFSNYFYYFNTIRPPFDDPRVRKAFTLAIKRDSICGPIVKRDQQPAFSFVPPISGLYEPAVLLTENEEEARHLLAEAGYPNGKNFPSIELLFNTSDVNRPIAEALQQRFKEVLNVNISLVNQEWKVFLNNVHNRNFDLARFSIMGDYLDPLAFLETLVSYCPQNYANWSNKEYDHLIQSSSLAATPKERIKILQQAETVLLREAPVLPIYFRNQAHLVQADVHNWFVNPLGLQSYTSTLLIDPANAFCLPSKENTKLVDPDTEEEDF